MRQSKDISKFPELSRAKNLFTELLYATNALQNLFYTSEQIKWADMSFSLIKGTGIISSAIDQPFPYLSFDISRDGADCIVDILEMPEHKGYAFHGIRDSIAAQSTSKNQEERAIDILYAKSPVILFGFRDVKTACILLLKDREVVADLESLVRETIKHCFCWDLNEDMSARQVLNPDVKNKPVIGVYNFAWADAAHTEFVVKVTFVDNREPEYSQFRILPPLADASGSVIPVGEEPNVSRMCADQIITEKKFMRTGGAPYV